MNQVEVKRRQIQSFSYVLACINIWVFGKSIGDNGLGYLAAAVLVFALFWVLTGKNLPDRMGRMLRGRNARGQYRNVSRMRKNMMLFQIAEGLLGTVLCMSLGWILLEKVFLVPYGSMILWILSPALFLRCIQSVFLGYFQSEGSEMPSAVSSVLRQVFFLGLGLVFLGIFRNYGEKVSLLLKRTDFTSMYGAMGIAVGMLLSEVLVLLFVFVIYRGSMAGRREAESGMKGTDSFASQLRTLLIPMGGDILRDMFLLLPLWIGLLFFQKRSTDIYASVSAYGIFVGRYLITLLMPVAILSAGILPGVARTGSHIRKKEERYARTAFQAGVQGTVVHGFFFTAWIAVLATPLSQALDKSVEMALTGLLTTGSSLILWLLLLFYFSEILELRGEKHLLLAGYGILDIVSIVILLILLNTGNTTTALSLSLVLGTAAGGIVLGILACLRMKTWPDLLRTLAIPAGSCCACGLLAFGLEKICLPHLGAMVTVLLELVITGAVYWFLLLMLRSFRGQDLNYVPGGKVLRAFGKMLRLL